VSDFPPIPPKPSVLPRVLRALALLALTVVVVIGGWKGFKYMKLHLALVHAQREFSNRQFMRAEFWTERALHVDGENVEAIRIIAEISEVQDRPIAVGWRNKVAQLQPHNTGDIMAWAKCAFRFGQMDMALTALKGLPDDFKGKNAEYHELMAGCALAAHDTALAEKHFALAAELGRDNPVHQVNLAAFRLTNSSRPEVKAAAIHDLEELLKDPRASLYAVRALLDDALQKNEQVRTQLFAKKLRLSPGHTFGDDLIYLQATITEPSFHPDLDEIEHRAESDPLWATQTANWLNSHGMAAEAVHWFSKLPESIRASTRVQVAISESYLALSDWKGLQTYLEACHWDDSEFLRRAMLIRCKRELSLPWQNDWKQLAADVEDRPPQGFLLAQLVIGWNWRNESLDLLWGASTKPETDAKALHFLWQLYSQANETRNLLRVARAQIKLDPSNPVKKNNAAFLSLLVYGASESSERLAHEALEANPNVPEWAATYAYALHLAGKESEAKKVIDKLPPEAVGRPGVALYVAIVLAANGEADKAKESLAKLNPGGMLPEERTLAENLKQQLKVVSR